MSLFGAFHDADMLMSNCMRQMRQMDSMMSSIFRDPFGDMMGDMGMPLSIMGPRHNALMPFMPDMNLNRLMTDNMTNGHCNSFSSSTIIMSNGPGGKPQVYSSTSSTKIGPNGLKETRHTVEDSRVGMKKMTIGHHINERAHIIEREKNYLSGDTEERQEFINLDEEEAEDFNREFQQRARYGSSREPRGRLMPSRQALPALPAPPVASNSRKSGSSSVGSRRAPKHASSNLALPASSSSANVRHTYGSTQPQRSKHRSYKNHHNSDY